MKDPFANISVNSPSSSTYHQERQDHRVHENGYDVLSSFGQDNTEYTNRAEGAYLTEGSLQAFESILARLSDEDLIDIRHDTDESTLRQQVFQVLWAYLAAQEYGLHWKTLPNKGGEGAPKQLASTESHFTPDEEKDFISPSDLIKFLLEKSLPRMDKASDRYTIGTKLLSLLKEMPSISTKRIDRKRKCKTLAQSASPKNKKSRAAPKKTQASSPKKKKSGSCNGTQSGKKSARKNDSSKKKGNGKDRAPSNVIDSVGGSRFSQLAELVTWLRQEIITREQFDALRNELFREQP